MMLLVLEHVLEGWLHRFEKESIAEKPAFDSACKLGCAACAEGAGFMICMAAAPCAAIPIGIAGSANVAW